MSHTEKLIRIPYIDIAKGILILFLLYGHSTICTRILGHDDNVMGIWDKTVSWYNSFFMSSFFIITGFCSSYKGSFITILWKNIKTLILPSILLVLICGCLNDLFLQKQLSTSRITELPMWLVNKGPWFIMVLFWCKIIYWFLNRVSVKWQWTIITVLYAIGLVLNHFNVIPNYGYHRHVLLFLPYLAFGAWMKTKPEYLEKYLKPVAIFGAVTITLQWLLSGAFKIIPLPSLDFYVNVDFASFPQLLINGVTGTAFVVYISKLIDRSHIVGGFNRILINLGKGTLLLYLGNTLFQNIATTAVYSVVSPSNFMLCALIHVCAYLGCVLFGYLAISIIFNTKYLSWIVGKWSFNVKTKVDLIPLEKN